MKTAFKVIGKILKGYLIVDGLFLAFIGAGNIIARVDRHPEETMTDTGMHVFNVAVSRWKKFFGWFKEAFL